MAVEQWLWSCSCKTMVVELCCLLFLITPDVERWLWSSGCGAVAVKLCLSSFAVYFFSLPLMYSNGCGVAVELWLWNYGCRVSLLTFYRHPRCITMAVEQWLWSCGCETMVVELWLWPVSGLFGFSCWHLSRQDEKSTPLHFPLISRSFSAHFPFIFRCIFH